MGDRAGGGGLKEMCRRLRSTSFARRAPQKKRGRQPRRPSGAQRAGFTGAAPHQTCPLPSASPLCPLGQAGDDATGRGWRLATDLTQQKNSRLPPHCRGCGWPSGFPGGPRGAVFGRAACSCRCVTPSQRTPRPFPTPGFDDGVTHRQHSCTLCPRADRPVRAPSLPVGPPWPVAAPTAVKL